MASIKREIKHTLGLEGGKKAVDGLLDKLKAEYGSILATSNGMPITRRPIFRGRGLRAISA